MTGIRNAKKKYVIYCISIFYDNGTTNPTKVYMLLSCVLRYVIDNYVCVDYLCCRYKTISDISSDKFKKNKSYNNLLGIGILEVLMNLI